MGLDRAKIKRLREQAALTHAAAAERAGLKGRRQAWYDIEAGRRANIKLETLERVAKALGVKAKDLLK